MKKRWKIKLINHFLSLHAGISRVDKHKEKLSDVQTFNRIVIFSTTALGDFLFNTPAIKAIRKRYPNAKIMLVSSNKNRELVENSDWFSEVVIWDNKIKNAYSVIKAIHKFQPDITFLLHSRIGYDILCARLGGSKYIVRDNFANDTTAFNRWIDLYSPQQDTHIIQRKLNLLSVLGCDHSDSTMQFPTARDAANMKAPYTTVGFQMGASEKLRCWPVEHFAMLAERILTERPNAKLILTGAGQDQPIEAAFFRALPEKYHSNVISYIGKTRLPALINLIYSFDVLVTGDTGPLHIAITAKTPTISLYVSANPRHTGPYQDLDIHQTIRIEPEKDDDANYPLRKISVEQVFNAVQSVIER